MQNTGIRFASARYGWLSSVKRDGDGRITGFGWTRHKAGAMLLPFERRELIDEIHGSLYRAGIMHDMITR